MIKLSLVLAAGALAVSSLQAEEQACCAEQASNSTASAQQCRANYTNLNLSAEQKAKMDSLMAKCTKSGCTKESMATFMKRAKGILSKEQYASFKAECSKMKHSEKAQS